jgi:hypothetical protein
MSVTIPHEEVVAAYASLASALTALARIENGVPNAKEVATEVLDDVSSRSGRVAKAVLTARSHIRAEDGDKQ